MHPPCSKQVIDRLNGCSIARKSRWRAQRESSAHSNGPLGLTGGHSCPHTVQLHNSSEHRKRKEKKAEREGDKERTCSLCSLIRATEAKHSASHNSPCITFNAVLATASRQFPGCHLLPTHPERRAHLALLFQPHNSPFVQVTACENSRSASVGSVVPINKSAETTLPLRETRAAQIARDKAEWRWLYPTNSLPSCWSDPL